jgi:hypothetical protein
MDNFMAEVNTQTISGLTPNPAPALSDNTAIDNAAKKTYKTSDEQRLNLFAANWPSPTQSVFVSNNGNDTTGTGISSNPYKTVAKALSVISDATITKQYTIYLNGPVTETNTVALLPFVNILSDGNIWNVQNVSMDSSWDTVQHGSIKISNVVFKVNGTFILSSNNTTLTGCIIIFDNCSPILSNNSTINMAFTLSQEYTVFFNNCVLHDIFDVSTSTITINTFPSVTGGTLLVQGGVFFPRLRCINNETGNAWSLYFNNTIINPDFWYIRSAVINFASCDFSLIGGPFPFLKLLDYCFLTIDPNFETTAFIQQGESVASATKNSGGTGYTSATVTFSAPSITNGITATGTANIVGDAVDSITITQQGAGYITPPTVTISGDGTGADYTAVLQNTNQITIYTNDTVIAPSYSPSNFTPTTQASGFQQKDLYNYLEGIDNQLHTFGGRLTGDTTIANSTGVCPPPRTWILDGGNNNVNLPSTPFTGERHLFINRTTGADFTITVTNSKTVTGYLTIGLSPINTPVTNYQNAASAPEFDVSDNSLNGQFIEFAADENGNWVLLENFGYTF